MATLLATFLAMASAGTVACSSEHEECVGFVVADDGQVGLSGLSDEPPGSMGDGGGGHGGMGDAGMGDAGTGDGGMADGGMGFVLASEVGHLHGMCVGITANAGLAAAGTSDGAFKVAASSLRGLMTTDAPDNEGFSLVIKKKDGTPATGLTVVLKARMPHHDHTIPGGHGPKNDMMVNGLPAVETDGTYVVDPIDFQMMKYWFFDVVINDGATERHAYFAMEVAATGG